MTQQITLSGLVATTPRHIVTEDGLAITSFRLASSDRRWNANLNKWIDGETNWYTVTAFKTLAINASNSINKGDRIVVVGDLRIRDWDNGNTTGTSVEIEATAMGHDLYWGISGFERTVLVRDDNSPDTPVKTHTCNCSKCPKKENN